MEQLYKKDDEQYVKIYPLSYIQNIIDSESGKNLTSILSAFNNIYLPYQGNVQDTRSLVPKELRRKGLWISYNNGEEYITEYYIGTVEDMDERWSDDHNWERVPSIEYVQSEASKIPDGVITPSKLSPALQELIRGIRHHSTITNIPDDEDLEEVNSVIRFKDRKYCPELASGKGYKMLRKNWVKVGNKTFNVLTQEMITAPNTVYIIRYDYNLNEKEITIPEGCVLDFQGGSLSNGTVVFNATSVFGNWFRRINNVSFNYKFTNDDNSSISVDYFGADNSGKKDSINAIQNAIDYCSFNNLTIPINFNGTYFISKHIVCNSNTYLKGNGSSIIWDTTDNSSYSSDNIITNKAWSDNNIQNSLDNPDSNITVEGFIINGEGGTQYYNEENKDSIISSIPRGVLAFRGVNKLIITDFKRVYQEKLQPIWTVDCSDVTIQNCYIERLNDSNQGTSGIWCYAFKTDIKNYKIQHNTIIARQDECINFSQTIKYNTSDKPLLVSNIDISFNTLISYRSATIAVLCRAVDCVKNITIHNNELQGGAISIASGSRNVSIYDNYYTNEKVQASYDIFNRFLRVASNEASNFVAHDIKVINNIVTISSGTYFAMLDVCTNVIINNNIIDFQNSENKEGKLGNLLYIGSTQVRYLYFTDNRITAANKYYNLVYTDGQTDLIISKNVFNCYNIVYIRVPQDNKVNRTLSNFICSYNEMRNLYSFINGDTTAVLKLQTVNIDNNILGSVSGGFAIFKVRLNDTTEKINVTFHNNSIPFTSISGITGFRGINVTNYTDTNNFATDTGKLYVNGYDTVSETKNRPPAPHGGFCFYDTSLSLPIWWEGNKKKWLSAIGTEIPENGSASAAKDSILGEVAEETLKKIQIGDLITEEQFQDILDQAISTIVKKIDVDDITAEIQTQAKDDIDTGKIEDEVTDTITEEVRADVKEKNIVDEIKTTVGTEVKESIDAEDLKKSITDEIVNDAAIKDITDNITDVVYEDVKNSALTEIKGRIDEDLDIEKITEQIQTGIIEKIDQGTIQTEVQEAVDKVIGDTINPEVITSKIEAELRDQVNADTIKGDIINQINPDQIKDNIVTEVTEKVNVQDIKDQIVTQIDADTISDEIKDEITDKIKPDVIENKIITTVQDQVIKDIDISDLKEQVAGEIDADTIRTELEEELKEEINAEDIKSSICDDLKSEIQTQEIKDSVKQDITTEISKDGGLKKITDDITSTICTELKGEIKTDEIETEIKADIKQKINDDLNVEEISANVQEQIISQIDQSTIKDKVEEEVGKVISEGIDTEAISSKIEAELKKQVNADTITQDIIEEINPAEIKQTITDELHKDLNVTTIASEIKSTVCDELTEDIEITDIESSITSSVTDEICRDLESKNIADDIKTAVCEQIEGEINTSAIESTVTSAAKEAIIADLKKSETNIATEIKTSICNEIKPTISTESITTDIKEAVLTDLEEQNIETTIKDQVSTEIKEKINVTDISTAIKSEIAGKINTQNIETAVEQSINTDTISTNVKNDLVAKINVANITTAVKSDVEAKINPTTIADAVKEQAIQKVNIADIETRVEEQSAALVDIGGIEEDVTDTVTTKVKAEINTIALRQEIKEQVCTEINTPTLKQEITDAVCVEIDADSIKEDIIRSINDSVISEIIEKVKKEIGGVSPQT